MTLGTRHRQRHCRLGTNVGTRRARAGAAAFCLTHSSRIPLPETRISPLAGSAAAERLPLIQGRGLVPARAREVGREQRSDCSRHRGSRSLSGWRLIINFFRDFFSICLHPGPAVPGVTRRFLRLQARVEEGDDAATGVRARIVVAGSWRESPRTLNSRGVLSPAASWSLRKACPASGYSFDVVLDPEGAQRPVEAVRRAPQCPVLGAVASDDWTGTVRKLAVQPSFGAVP